MALSCFEGTCMAVLYSVAQYAGYYIQLAQCVPLLYPGGSAFDIIIFLSKRAALHSFIVYRLKVTF